MMVKIYRESMGVIDYSALEIIREHKVISKKEFSKLYKDETLEFTLDKLEEARKIKIEGNIITFLSM